MGIDGLRVRESVKELVSMMMLFVFEGSGALKTLGGTLLFRACFLNGSVKQGLFVLFLMGNKNKLTNHVNIQQFKCNWLITKL